MNREESLHLRYTELCKSYHAIRDFRAKLLGLLPLASGGGIIILLEYALSVHLIGVGAIGVTVTAGLLVYEFYNMKKCQKLICQGANLENELGQGQFKSHPLVTNGGCEEMHGTYGGAHFYAALMVYLSVIAGWLYIMGVGICMALGKCSTDVSK